MKKVLSIALLLSGVAHAATETNTEVVTAGSMQARTSAMARPTMKQKPETKEQPDENQKRAEEQRAQMYSDFDKSAHPADFVAATEQPLTKKQKEEIEKKHKKEMAQLRAQFEKAEKGRKEALAKLNATQAQLEKEATAVHTDNTDQEVKEMNNSTIISFLTLFNKAKGIFNNYLQENPELNTSLEQFTKAAGKNIDHLKRTYGEVKKVLNMEALYMNEQFTETLKEIASEFQTMLTTLPKDLTENVTDRQKEALKSSMNKILLNVHTATTTVMKHVGTATDEMPSTESEKAPKHWAITAAEKSETATSPVSMEKKS